MVDTYTLFTFLVGWHTCAISLPQDDIIFAQLTCPLNNIIVCTGNNQRHNIIHRLICMVCLPALFWLSIYVASHHLAVVPQSGAKDQFYCIVSYITLNPNCEAQGLSKNLKKWRRLSLKAKLMQG